MQGMNGAHARAMASCDSARLQVCHTPDVTCIHTIRDPAVHLNHDKRTIRAGDMHYAR